MAGPRQVGKTTLVQQVVEASDLPARFASADEPTLRGPEGFLRLVTNTRVFPDPTPIDVATEFLDALLSAPGVEIPSLGREWPLLRHLIIEQSLSGNAIPDAWIAAAIRANNGHLVTFDRGFTKLLSRREVTVLTATS